jgi:hypothetical protein
VASGKVENKKHWAECPHAHISVLLHDCFLFIKVRHCKKPKIVMARIIKAKEESFTGL